MSNWTDKVIHHSIWSFIFGGLGSTGFLFMLGKTLFGFSLIKSVCFAFLLSLLVFSLLVFWYSGKDIIIFLTKKKYNSVWGIAIVKLKDAYSGIHDIRKKTNVDDEEFLRVLTLLCDNLKAIFDKNTGSSCSVSIKVPVSMVENPREMEVRNLCRDNAHFNRDTERYRQAHHTVIGNTAYFEVVMNILNNRSELAYVNNDINGTKDYHNTSFDCYNNGQLDYESEMVYPILPIKLEGHNYKLFGFICIDCKKKNGFDEVGFEIPMVQGVADGIYDIIEKRINQKEDDGRVQIQSSSRQ